MNKPGHVSELHVQEIGGITSPNGEISQLSAGKLNCQRLHELAETKSGGADIADVERKVVTFLTERESARQNAPFVAIVQEKGSRPFNCGIP
jgi:hypothetical protein